MKPYRERAEHAWTDDSVRLIATPSPFAKSSLFYIQEIGHFRTMPCYFTERERLDSFLVLYTVSGKGKLTYGNKSNTLLPRQVFFIDCMEYQHYAPESEEPWEMLWVHLNGQSVRAYYEQYAQNGDPVRTLPPDTGLPSVLRELIELQRTKSIRHELLASKALVHLLTELLLAGPEFDASVSEMPAYVADVVKLVEKRYREKLTLDFLARSFNVNKYHLAKEFKKHTGLSPGEYIINARTTRAKELLRYTELSVAEIAEQIGIDNVSHFIHLFKDRVGQTPLVFRKTWRAP